MFSDGLATHCWIAGEAVERKGSPLREPSHSGLLLREECKPCRRCQSPDTGYPSLLWSYAAGPWNSILGSMASSNTAGRRNRSSSMAPSICVPQPHTLELHILINAVARRRYDSVDVVLANFKEEELGPRTRGHHAANAVKVGSEGGADRTEPAPTLAAGETINGCCQRRSRPLEGWPCLYR